MDTEPHFVALSEVERDGCWIYLQSIPSSQPIGHLKQSIRRLAKFQKPEKCFIIDVAGASPRTVPASFEELLDRYLGDNLIPYSSELRSRTFQSAFKELGDMIAKHVMRKSATTFTPWRAVLTPGSQA
jgi:hypothetical protein